MKKSLLLLLILSILSVNGFGKPRSQSEALDIANTFYSNTSALRSTGGNQSLSLAYVCKDDVSTRSSAQDAYYYVFNSGDNNGFIIVSGDDRAKEVLGYSDMGDFDINTIPSNLKYWLSFYQTELKMLMETSELELSLDSEITDPETRSALATSVSPLLGDIKWDQGNPYNMYCPTLSNNNKAATGCVATAIAQIMKYHQWPAKGIGSNSYTSKTNGFNLSVDFSKTTYNWGNMTSIYNNSSTQVQNEAVATLMYHCGVAFNMDYDSESGTSSGSVGVAMPRNFDYDKGLTAHYRDYYTSADWINMIKTELNASRPVYYSGQSSSGGHAFVCDGYDTSGLFHFNWGWGGTANGYFELSALNPSSIGTGGGSGGYNTSQDIILNLKPNSGTTSVGKSDMGFKSFSTAVTSVNLGTKFKLNAKVVQNIAITPFTGKFGVALYNSNDVFVRYIDYYNTSSVPGGAYYADLDFEDAVLPTTLAAGSYKLRLIFEESTASGTYRKMVAKKGIAEYINVTVSGGKATFGTPTDNLPNLGLKSLKAIGTLYNNKTGRFSIDITNSGTGEYNSNLIILLQSSSNSSVKQIVANDPVVIAAGETKTIGFSGEITLSAGSYKLGVFYDTKNFGDEILNNAVNFSLIENVTIQAEPIGNSVITLTEKMSFPDAANVNKKNIELTAKIKNTGIFYDNYVVALVFKPEGGYNVDYFGLQQILIDNNEAATLKFNGSSDLDAGEYFAITYYYDASGNLAKMTPDSYQRISFTLVEDGTGIEQNSVFEKLGIYPNPTTDNLYFVSDDIVKTVQIFNILGKQVFTMNPETNGLITIPVSGLENGTYILNTVTENGTISEKFLKK